MRITLQDIADRAGLSRSGVSRALKNDTTIPKATCLRVQKIADEMHYRPNPYITALMTDLRGTRLARDQAVVGLVTNFKPRDEWKRIICQRRFHAGLAERASALGYSVEEFCRTDPRMTSARLHKILLTRSVRGLVIAPTPYYRAHFNLDWNFFTCITMDYSLWRPQLSRSCTNQIQCVAEAIRHLRHLGYRKIGLAVNQDNDNRVSRNWSAGYLSRMRVPQEIDSPLILIAEPWSPEVFVSWLKSARPEVVISPHIEALDWMQTAGIRVPDQIGFVCLDWSPDIEPCAGVDQKCEMVGSNAMDMLVSSIQRNEFGLPKNPVTQLVEGSWVDGPTVRRIKVGIQSE